MKNLLRWYFSVSLVLRILAGIASGAIIGITLWLISKNSSAIDVPKIISRISPFGNVFVYMLKMIVIPVIFFSLVTGAASLPLKRFGAIGAKVIGWYLFTSLLSAMIGVFLALLINPASGSNLADWNKMASDLSSEAAQIGSKSQTDGSFSKLLYSMFQNPFQSLAEGNFLAIIVFSILFGLAVRACIEASNNQEYIDRLLSLLRLANVCRDVIFKLVDWVLEYSPIGIFALTIVNFSLYGPRIVGPYISITLGVITGIIFMIFIVFPVIMWLATGKNPFVVLKKIQEAMIMAFTTRSSAATLPVTLKIAQEELKVHSELASFSLPLGATINMDGVCLHLPMFAILASNMFGIQITAFDLVVLVMVTVLAAIGTGGVPGGSLMLLFIILKPLGLSNSQISIIVALALGINPILDMFETMANVTGDLLCTYVVASREKLISD
ncbi:MAG TPA: dicarboxylate/amino acid:cation symporter [Phycisphaerales bacterium]|nr:dicarboxylate/amino acid:cation symporter [Phycisphaerales bacterium]